MSNDRSLGILRADSTLSTNATQECSVDDCVSIEQSGITDVECDCVDEEEAGM